jgi:hypothetical protein
MALVASAWPGSLLTLMRTSRELGRAQKTGVAAASSRGGPSTEASGASDVHGLAPVRNVAVVVTAGARVDLGIPMPADGSAVRGRMGGPSRVVAVTSRRPGGH